MQSKHKRQYTNHLFPSTFTCIIPLPTDNKADEDQKKDDIKVLDAGDIQVLKTYGRGPYADQLKKIENEIEEVRKRVNERMGVKESETGLAPPNLVRRQRCGLAGLATSFEVRHKRADSDITFHSGTFHQIHSAWAKNILSS